MDKISQILERLERIEKLLVEILTKMGRSNEDIVRLLTEPPVTPPGKPGKPGG